MSSVNVDLESLKEKIRSMAPWHHDIVLNDELSTGRVFSQDGTLLSGENGGVSLISPFSRFMQRAEVIYPDGMHGKRFLDCACNAGGYCFFARELGAEFSFGFDIREHWIDQAKFIQQHRQVAPTDRIEFRQMDLSELSSQNLEPFDFTYFSGIFYHLPDPVAGLKAAADLTKDVLLLNTAGMAESENPLGMTMVFEGVKPVMSGVHNLAWFPNSPQILIEILGWLGFKEMKIAKNVINQKKRRRMEILAAREPGRLDGIEGELVSSIHFDSGSRQQSK